MENFSFYAPTYFQFGKDAEMETAKLYGFLELEQKDVEAIYRLML